MVLKKKIGIVTGGAGFLGLEHVLALGEIETHVIIIDNNLKNIEKAKKFLKNKQLSYEFFLVDICNEKKLKSIAKKIIKKYRNINYLINNASIDYVPRSKSKVLNFENFNKNIWKKEIDIGLTGSFLCSKIFGTEMKKNGGGVIINVASDLSVIAPNQSLYSHLNFTKPITYSVIKHGIIGLTKYLATYWAKDKIRVNALSPGGVVNNQDLKFKKKIKKLIPMARMAKKHEYRGAIKFLCSEDSSYMTGHNLIIDGGRSVW